jgi:dienelactone hydrolase
MAVYAFVRRLPYVEPSRIILAGQSAGGLAALVAAGREPPGLAAVLAFAAGMGGDPRAHPGTPCAPEAMAELFSHMGRHVKAPVLLHYAQNDRFFGAKSSQVWFERFRSGGGSAEYALLPSFGADGHFVFTDAGGARYWVPVVDAFLRRHGLAFNPRVGA